MHVTLDSIDTLIRDLQRAPHTPAILEQLHYAAMRLYTQLYPQTHGGFFVPLSPTVGFTHCHYLDGAKHATFAANQFWLKCNLYTNTIEDLPLYLQPQNIREMLHMLYLITVWQNTYSTAHIVPTTFDETDGCQTGLFDIVDDKLVIIRNIDTIAYINENADTILQTHDYDVLLDDRSILPSWSFAKREVATFLNTRGYEALAEMRNKEQGLPSLQKYLIRNTPTITLGSHTFALDNIYSNIHMSRGILRLHNASGKSRKETIEIYHDYLRTYRHQTEQFDRVFFIGHIGSDPDDKGFDDFTGAWRDALRTTYAGEFFDYTPDVYPAPRPAPRQIIDYIASWIHDHPDDQILLSLGLHGEPDGSALYGDTVFLKEDFERLFDLAKSYPHLQLFIVSCRSAKKTNNLNGNIIMSSSNQVSYGYYIKELTHRYTQGYTLYQSHILASHEYNQSLLPTSFVTPTGRSVELCGTANLWMDKPAEAERE